MKRSLEIFLSFRALFTTDAKLGLVFPFTGLAVEEGVVPDIAL